MAAPAGNQNAAKAKLFEGALRRALNSNNRDRLYDIAEKLVQAAEAGESWAIQHVADRLDGKPKQAVEATGADGADLFSGITIKLVKADGTSS